VNPWPGQRTRQRPGQPGPVRQEPGRCRPGMPSSPDRP